MESNSVEFDQLGSIGPPVASRDPPSFSADSTEGTLVAAKENGTVAMATGGGGGGGGSSAGFGKMCGDDESLQSVVKIAVASLEPSRCGLGSSDSTGLL